MNKLKRESAFEKLLKELQESGFEKIDINILKTKIKTVKTVYIYIYIYIYNIYNICNL